MDGTEETHAFARPPDEPPRDDPTATFDTHSHLRPGYLALVFCTVAAAGLLVGIGIAAASRPKAPAPGGVNAEQIVGPSGGTIRFDDGQLEIPPDALAQPTRIVIRRSSFTDRIRVLPPAGGTEVFDPGGLSAYAFEPKNAAFHRPVQIVFRLPAGDRNGTAFARSGNDIVILGGTVDPDRETVTITIDNFRFDRSTK
jgi:hypothetical protein